MQYAVTSIGEAEAGLGVPIQPSYLGRTCLNNSNRRFQSQMKLCCVDHVVNSLKILIQLAVVLQKEFRVLWLENSISFVLIFITIQDFRIWVPVI